MLVGGQVKQGCEIATGISNKNVSGDLGKSSFTGVIGDISQISVGSRVSVDHSFKNCSHEEEGIGREL